tara:strand:+ start:66521 stop:68398 length:1878 start_codon:yes stop_codon:yes gene_type:complete
MNQKGKLDSLRTDLYKKTASRRGFSPTTKTAAPKAVEQEAWTPPVQKEEKPHKPYATWFLLGSAGFFALAIIIAAFFVLQGGRTVSPKNIEFNVEIPPAIASGESVLIQATVKNTNPVNLPFAELTVTFPTGTRDALDVSKELQYKTLSLGPLKPGEKKELAFEGVLFGTEGEEKEIKLRIEFRPESSNAIVVKEEVYPVIITSAPLAVTLSAPEEVAPGESFSTTITVQTNSEESVPNAVLLLEYPFGYSVRDANPTADIGNNVWDLGTLKPGEKETVTITGDIVGNSGDERFINAYIGTDLSPGGNSLGLIYMEQNVKVALVDSQLAVSMSLDGDASESLTVDAGDDLTGRLTWKNNLDSQIFDAEIKITFSGNAFDETRISAGRGFYNAGTKTITFNKETNSELATLDPEERGTVTFTLPIKTTAELGSARNPALDIVGTVSGREVGSGAPSTVTNKVERDISIASALSLATSLTRTTGPFTNIGPWPPKAGELTTYTLTLIAGNTTNTIANSAVRFVLPSYATFTGAQTPLSAAITHDERTGEVSWNIGEIAAHSSKTVALQVGITPQSSQAGDVIQVIGQQIFEGFDRFTQTTVQTIGGAKTTAITDDPSYTGAQGVVSN